MFSLYKFSKSKKSILIAAPQEIQIQINALVKALHLKILVGYTGNEDRLTVLKKEQAEDDNREKGIQQLKDRIEKISKKDKSKALDLKSCILQKDKVIGLIGSAVKSLTARKNEAIKLYDAERWLQILKKEPIKQLALYERVEKFSNEEITRLIPEDEKPRKFSELQDKTIEDLYLKSEQEFLRGIYIKEEKSQLEKKFKDLKAISGQETAADEMKERLKTIILASNGNYHTVIVELQNLIADLNVTKSVDLQNLKDMDVVKFAKKLSNQKALLQKYKEYLQENKKGDAQIRMSPAHHRTRLVMEANMLRAQLNRKVIERVNQKYNEKIQQRYVITEPNLKLNDNDMNFAHINFAAQYCIAKLEQVDSSVQENLRKQCIDAGRAVDKQKGLIYDNQNSILLMSDIYELSYNAYIEMGERQLAEKPEVNLQNLQNFQIVVAKPKELTLRKRMLPAFEQEIEKSKQKLVPYKKLSSFWLFYLNKALIAVKPEVMSLMKLNTSLCERTARVSK